MAIPATARTYYYPSSESISYNSLKIKEVPVSQPRANEVLVKVHAVSLQFRDLMISHAKYPIPTPPDLVPCSDMAGEIVGIGADAKGWNIGDRVCANFSLDHVYGDPTAATIATALGGSIHGVLTEYLTFPDHSLVKFPDHLSYEEASTLPCAALTAYNALYGPVPVKAGDHVLVLGTGGAALQFAVAAGATVIATSSSDDKLTIASKLGAKLVVNYKKHPNYSEEILKFTNGRGVDHIIEIGGYGTLPETTKAVRMGGWLHAIGVIAAGTPNVDLVSAAIYKSCYLRGILIGSVQQFTDMNRLLAANPEVTRPVVDKVFAFEDASKAFAYLESQAHVGKVVIKVSKN